MKVFLKAGQLVLVPESEGEVADLAAWKTERSGHVLAVQNTAGEGVALIDLGLREDACNEPFQIASFVKDPAAQLISNFAATPFALDGREYASVESFWQGLKFAKESERRRIAALPGPRARQEGEAQGYGETVEYEGETIPVGAWRHWQLMQRACRAKFTQNEEAREALMSTGERPLVHRVRRDSRTIPGVIMAEIWMKIRRKLREGDEGE
jgi:predicted NAD-dependent protein-ADP-ribosyltransferase YbiA (DUF1768 family)